MLSTIMCFAASNNQEDIYPLLSELSIMKGDPNGNLRLDDSVSRAEFTKVAVSASFFRNSVATNLTISPFKDVLYTHWAAPYIKLAVSNNICKGYPNATFNPDGKVLFEEAVTMLLKVLGYTDNDFGISWPYGQVGLANNLDITKNVSSKVGDTLTRRDVATLVYNTLDTKMKGTNQKLITTFDCQIIENVTIIATTKEDSSIGSTKVLTTSGIYEINNSFNYLNVGKKGDIVIKNGDDVVSFAPIEQTVKSYDVTSVIGSDLVLNDAVLNINENLKTYYKSQTTTYKNAVALAESGDTFVTFSNQNGVIDYAMLLSTHSQAVDINVNALEKYIVYSKLENAIVGYKNGTFSQIDIKDSTVCYKDKLKTTYIAVKAELSMGDIIYVKRDSSNLIEYVSYEKGNIDGPSTVTSSDWDRGFNKDAGTTVMRNGNKVNPDDIEINDVVYYSKDLNMILAYSNKVTGIYGKALPNKDMPTSVVVSGVSYTIESVTAFNKLSSSGSFNYGDTVTLLLGKTNQIADVISPDSANSDMYAYMFETGKKEFTKSDNTKYTDYYVKVALPDGGVYEYIANKDYEDAKNSVVKLTFKNGVVKVITPKMQSEIVGTFNWAGKKLGKYIVSTDIDVLDVSCLDKNKMGNYTTVFPQRIDGVNLDSRDVLFACINDDNKITTLFLNDVTGDAYKYGIVTKGADSTSAKTLSIVSTKGQSQFKYTYDIGGVSNEFVSNNTVFRVSSGQPARFAFTGLGTVDNIQAIEKTEGAITNLTNSELTAGKNKYLISDKVTVYKKNFDNSYMIIPIADIINSNEYSLSAYYDKAITSGGRVRVIVASKK